MKKLGYGRGYVYAHDTDEGVAGLDCLPDAIQGTVFYAPSANGFEQRLAERLAEFRARRERARARR